MNISYLPRSSPSFQIAGQKASAFIMTHQQNLITTLAWAVLGLLAVAYLAYQYYSLQKREILSTLPLPDSPIQTIAGKRFNPKQINSTFTEEKHSSEVRKAAQSPEPLSPPLPVLNDQCQTTPISSNQPLQQESSNFQAELPGSVLTPLQEADPIKDKKTPEKMLEPIYSKEGSSIRVAGKLTLPGDIIFEGVLTGKQHEPAESPPIFKEEKEEVEQADFEHFNGKGKITYPNGNIADGSFLNGQLEGLGFVFYEAGQVKMEGTFAAGCLVMGKINYHGEETLEGRFQDEKLCGPGKITHKSGVVKQGDFIDNKLEGRGEVLYPFSNEALDSLIKIEGVFKNDQLIEGMRIYSDKVLSGTYKDNQLDGIGSIAYENGDIILEGEFCKGRLCGLGRIIYKDGTRLEGFFKDDELNGLGRISYCDGQTVKGWFVQGQLNGIGKLEHPDGSISEGEFKNNLLHGLGEIIQEDGLRMRGHFQKDLLNGFGQVIQPNQNPIEGVFREGVLIRSMPIQLPKLPVFNVEALTLNSFNSDEELCMSPFINSLIDAAFEESENKTDTQN